MNRTRLHLLGIALLLPTIALTSRSGAAAPLALDSDTELQRAMERDETPHASHAQPTSPLVQKVLEATERFRDPQVAIDDGKYVPFGGCVSGPEFGAMGVHFVNPAFLQDKKLEVTEPEALIYELQGGRARLVGVEYIIPAVDWDTANGDVPPVLEGQLFHFVDSPNRFRLPAHYELHVWAYRDNPNGTFVDWNPRVSCDGQ